MDDAAAPHRFYDDLAEWWPLISPVEEYRGEAEYIAGLLAEAAPAATDLLELGSGGGHIAHHLTRYDRTLVDLSPSMLQMSAALNPTAGHVVGDMRTVRLGRTFDIVLVHDAIAYMTSEADLLAALSTAAAHCPAGGLALFVPDDTAEIFEADTSHGGSDAADGRGARYLAWTVGPGDGEPAVTTTTYSFLLRNATGEVESVTEVHRTGLFPRATWMRLLAEAGFDAVRLVEETDEERTPRDVFLARRR